MIVRPLTGEDAPYLVKWLSDPKVLKFYEGRDRPHDLRLVKEYFYTDQDNTSPFIVLYDEKEIGYIQYYLVDSDEFKEYGIQDEPGSIYGMDQFIGEAEYWNMGIGTKLVRAMTEYLTKTTNARKVIMDPQAWNYRAIRCYGKCGFVKGKYLPKHEWHEGSMRNCWLMVYTSTYKRVQSERMKWL